MKYLRGFGPTEHRKQNDVFPHTKVLDLLADSSQLRDILEQQIWGRGNRKRHGTWDPVCEGQIQVRSSTAVTGIMMLPKVLKVETPSKKASKCLSYSLVQYHLARGTTSICPFSLLNFLSQLLICLIAVTQVLTMKVHSSSLPPKMETLIGYLTDVWHQT